MGNLDVLLVSRTCAEHYPPTVNQANLISRHALSVGLIDLFQRGVGETVGAGVRRWRAHAAWDSKTEAPRSLFRRWQDWTKFRRICQQTITKERPKVVLAYDIAGSSVVPCRPHRYKVIYHFHELPEVEARMVPATRLALVTAKRRSRQANLVVLPDRYRADIFRKDAHLPNMPMVVMNFPARMVDVPKSPMQSELQSRGLSDRSVVCYLGSVGANQGLAEAALSMRCWPANSIFVLVGAYAQSIREKILSNAHEAGADSRVIFFGPQPHQTALAMVAGANLGLSLIQPKTNHLVYSAGAINKRFEYMALGVPQITNNGPGVSELVEKTGCGICVDPDSPEQIGNAVAEVLGNTELCSGMAVNARRWHLAEFHYERQFAPMLKWIAERSSRPHGEQFAN